MPWILGLLQGLSDQCIGVRFASCGLGKTYWIGSEAPSYIIVIEIHDLLILLGYRVVWCQS